MKKRRKKNSLKLTIAGAVLIFGHTNCVTFLFSKSLNEFLLTVLLHRNTFDKVAAATQIDAKKINTQN